MVINAPRTFPGTLPRPGRWRSTHRPDLTLLATQCAAIVWVLPTSPDALRADPSAATAQPARPRVRSDTAVGSEGTGLGALSFLSSSLPPPLPRLAPPVPQASVGLLRRLLLRFLDVPAVCWRLRFSPGFGSHVLQRSHLSTLLRFLRTLGQDGVLHSHSPQ